MPTAATLASSVTAQPVHATRNAITVLLVDDTDTVRELLRAVLMMQGYAVLTAPDGPSALEVASRTRIDMLVTDFQMPGMDGCTLAVRLTERHAALPVLVISGADPSDLPLAEIERRQWNFLPKPLDNACMFRIIDGECLSRTARYCAGNAQTA